MTTLTKQQFKALWAAFKKNGAWYGRTGGAMGGAYRRMCKRLADQHLVSASAPYPITRKGMVALHDACRVRWAKSGCMAYQDDLNEVEAALKAVSAAGFRLRYRFGSKPWKFFLDPQNGRKHARYTTTEAAEAASSRRPLLPNEEREIVS
jgi:hypothetical protein